MENKVIFLDRDGTINEDYGYVYEQDKLVFKTGVIEGLSLLQQNGFKLIIITNQSGISRGFYTEEEYLKFTDYMLLKLSKENIDILDVYYCKHGETDNCDCRKPKLGLFYKAIEEHSVNLNNSYAIGDRERDLNISNFTSIKGLLISEKKSEKYNTYTNFLEAVKYILSKELE